MAASLTPAQRLDRQRADHKLLSALDEHECPISVTGHRSAADARSSRGVVAVGDTSPPSHYRVVYDFDTLSAPDRRHRPTIVHVAPLAGGNYPTTPPSAWVISDVIPWTPHFAADVPICHGNHVWIPNRTQLVDYVIHIGKLLNFDEPPPGPGYHGYNGAAIRYWFERMGLEPLDRSLRFPVIQLEGLITQPRSRVAQAPSQARFRSGQPRTRFASGLSAPTDKDEPRFRAVSRVAPDQHRRIRRLG